MPSGYRDDLTVYKKQMAYVFDKNGNFLDVLRDAPLLAGFKETISSGISPLRVQLPRSFDNFDQPGGFPGRTTISQGNIVRYYIYGPGLPAGGKIRFQGFIDTIEPEISESGAETVTITIVPFSSVIGDHGVTQNVTFGTSGSSGTYVDPVTIFKYWFLFVDPVVGNNTSYMQPLFIDTANSANSSGTTSQYTFVNQNMESIFSTILNMLPANWFYRVNPDNSTVINVPPTTAQHILYVGQNISNPQFREDWSNLRNVIVYQGGTTNGQTTGTIVDGHLVNGSISGTFSNASVNANASLPFNTSASLPFNTFANLGFSTGANLNFNTNTSFSGSYSGSVSGSSCNVFVSASMGVSGTASGSISGTASGSVSGTASGSVSGTASGSVNGSASGNVGGSASGGVNGNVLITTVPMQIVVKSNSSLVTFGERIVFVNDSRITDTNTLTILANGLLSQVNRSDVRTKIRVPDYRGGKGGYDIESLKVGDTVLVVDPTAPSPQDTSNSLWDVAKFDSGYWDYQLVTANGVSIFNRILTLVAIDYAFDYVDIELDTLMPNLSREVHAIQVQFQDYTMGTSALV
jgi:hypothetical protein